MYRSVVLGEVGNELWIISQACFELKTRWSKWEVPKTKGVFPERTQYTWEVVPHVLWSGMWCQENARRGGECNPWWGNARGLQRLEGDKTSFILQEVVPRNDLPSKYSPIPAIAGTPQVRAMGWDWKLLSMSLPAFACSRAETHPESWSNPRQFTEWICAMLTVLKCE